MSLDYKVAHPLDDVFELLTDPDFLVERSIGIGEDSADCEIEEDENGKIYITMNREVTRDLPSFLAKLFSAKQKLTMKETWQQVGSNWIGKGEYTVEGQPVNITIDITLKSEGDGCVYSTKYSAKAKIPMIGGKVEKYIKGNCEDGTRAEMDFLAAKLG